MCCKLKEDEKEKVEGILSLFFFLRVKLKPGIIDLTWNIKRKFVGV